MSIGAAITDALGYLREQAESMQTSQCTIVRNAPLADTAPDPVTGVVDPTATTVYSGACRVKPLKRVTAGKVDVGETTSSEAVFILSLPHSVTGLQPGDIARVTTSADGDLLVDTFRVINIEDGEQTTARRLTCELVEDRQA